MANSAPSVVNPIDVKINGPVEVGPITIKDEKDGTYTIDFVLHQEGDYLADIRIGKHEAPVPGNPLKLHAESPVDFKFDVPKLTHIPYDAAPTFDAPFLVDGAPETSGLHDPTQETVPEIDFLFDIPQLDQVPFDMDPSVNHPTHPGWKILFGGSGLKGGKRRFPARTILVKFVDSERRPVEVKPESVKIKLSPRVPKSKVRGLKPGTYGAVYWPDIGTILVTITVDGKPVLSDLKVVWGKPSSSVPDPTKAIVSGPVFNSPVAGKPTELSLTTFFPNGKQCSEGGEPVDIVVVHPRGEVSPASVKDNGDGTYTAAFTLPVPGDYLVQVALDEKPIEGSPFPIHSTLTDPTSDSHPVLSLPLELPLELLAASVPFDAVPDVKDVPAPGHNVLFGGSGLKGGIHRSLVCPIFFKIVGPKGSRPMEIDLSKVVVKFRPRVLKSAVRCLKPGLYGLAYLPHLGTVHISVIIAGKPALTDKEVVWGQTKVSLHPIKSVVSGPTYMSISGPKDVQIPVKVKDNNDGTYTIDFTPTVPGDFNVGITLDDQPVPGSPFPIHSTKGDPLVEPCFETISPLDFPFDIPLLD